MIRLHEFNSTLFDDVRQLRDMYEGHRLCADDEALLWRVADDLDTRTVVYRDEQWTAQELADEAAGLAAQVEAWKEWWAAVEPMFDNIAHKIQEAPHD